MALAYDTEALTELRKELDALRGAALALERSHEDDLAHIPEPYRDSARNLLHYVAVRKQDIRPLQWALHRLGLSSLGRMEAYVLAAMGAVQTALRVMTGDPIADLPSPVGFEDGRTRLRRHSDALLGPPPSDRSGRIMVTLGAEAAEEPELVERLLVDGMDVLRINCSKQDPDVWKLAATNLRAAEQRTGRRAKVMFDLAGPNPRTSTIEGDGSTKAIRLAAGDRLEIVADVVDAVPARYADDGLLLEPARISCTLPEVLADLRPGERFYIDDGACAGRVLEASPKSALIEIIATHGAFKMKTAKGMNFPDSDLKLPSLTAKDRADLAAVINYADIVSLSFVRRPSDVDELVDLLNRAEAKVGLVLKIETVQGFERLPSIILHALRRPPVGIMVARGDMGVELGFDRLAEAQEEVLWMGEAAHVPTIWATQVLESLTKTGHPSRAEVSDAAMAGRAECVMLNRGKHVDESVRFLSNILERMEAHQAKKLALLRRLGISAHV